MSEAEKTVEKFPKTLNDFKKDYDAWKANRPSSDILPLNLDGVSVVVNPEGRLDLKKSDKPTPCISLDVDDAIKLRDYLIDIVR